MNILQRTLAKNLIQPLYNSPLTLSLNVTARHFCSLEPMSILPKANRFEEVTTQSEFMKYYVKLQAVLDYKNKMRDKQKLEFGLLDKQKIVIEAKRLRRPMDTLKYLRDNQEVCALIEGRDEYPEMDIVFDIKQVSK